MMRLKKKSYATFSRFNRTKIRWSKNSKFLKKTRNVKLSKKGALRILDVTYRDSGVYACHAGLSMSELRLKVKPKPGDREATPADYESIEEEEEEENIIDIEGVCFNFSYFESKFLITMQMYIK